MKKTFKTLKKVFDILCWVVVAVLAVSIIMSFVGRMNGTIPSFFGYSIYRVSSGSMVPELNVGDIVIGEAIDDPMSINVGDIVTFKGSGELEGEFITHRVILAPQLENGVLTLQTKGDANTVPDGPISADRVVSVVITKVPILSYFYNFFFSPWGLLTIIGLVILVFIDEVIVMIKTITGNDKETEPENIDKIIERIKSEDSNISDGEKADIISEKDHEETESNNFDDTDEEDSN